MSSLPALEDLRTKALLEANPRLQPPSSLPKGQKKVIFVTPQSILQEHEDSQRLCPLRLSFQCSRIKPSHPPYKRIRNKHPPYWWEYHPHLFRFLLAVLPSLGLCIFIGLAVTAGFMTLGGHLNRERILVVPDTRWWRDAVFYEIFPASFLDTDGDGYGDFQGIVQKLDYIQSLGVTAIRLNSIFGALDYPLEYEHVIDLMNPDPHLGREEDFRVLVEEVHSRDLKIVLDINPTVTSDQHTWAMHWQREIPGYEQFYTSANRSKDPPEMEQSEGPPPDEWELPQRVFGGHYIVNWSCPMVQEEYFRALEHWTDLGVDGFYVKHLEHMHVSEPKDLYHVLRRWRNTLQKNVRKSSRALIASSRFATRLEKDLGGYTEEWHKTLSCIDLLDHPILVGSGPEMTSQVARIGRRHVSTRTPMWHLGSVDTFRFASRIDTKYQTAAYLLLMTLPGSVSIFYGDEIGLKDSYDTSTGRVYRGGQLSPMQWTSNNNTFGGFSTNTTDPWLPLNPEHQQTNVQQQQNMSLRQISRMVGFRQNTLTPHYGDDPILEVLDPNILILERKHKRQKSHRILFAANFGDVSEEKEFPDAYGNVRPLVTTPQPTRTRVRNKTFTLSPGAAFLAKVQLLYYAPEAEQTARKSP